MNQETKFILDALRNNPNGLDKHEIRKWIKNHYDHKITATKIKNYLWSYLKDEVNQNSEDFTYSLKVLPVKAMTIVVEQRQQARLIEFRAEGSVLTATYSPDVSIDDLVYALAAISLNTNPRSNTSDLSVRVNREIDAR